MRILSRSEPHRPCSVYDAPVASLPLVQSTGISSIEGPSSWLTFWIGNVGLILTIIGFWIAISQIRKTKTAAEAAANAAIVGTNRIRYNQLLILSPQMGQIEHDLDTAIHDDDKNNAEKAFIRWRQLAVVVHGLIGQMGPDYTDLAESIEKTRVNVISAKSKLVDPNNASKPVSVLISGVRKEISNANDRLGSVVGKLATEISTEGSS